MFIIAIHVHTFDSYADTSPYQDGPTTRNLKLPKLEASSKWPCSRVVWECGSRQHEVEPECWSMTILQFQRFGKTEANTVQRYFHVLTYCSLPVGGVSGAPVLFQRTRRIARTGDWILGAWGPYWQAFGYIVQRLLKSTTLGAELLLFEGMCTCKVSISTGQLRPSMAGCTICSQRCLAGFKVCFKRFCKGFARQTLLVECNIERAFRESSHLKSSASDERLELQGLIFLNLELGASQDACSLRLMRNSNTTEIISSQGIHERSVIQHVYLGRIWPTQRSSSTLPRS